MAIFNAKKKAREDAAQLSKRYDLSSNNDGTFSVIVPGDEEKRKMYTDLLVKSKGLNLSRRKKLATIGFQKLEQEEQEAKIRRDVEDQKIKAAEEAKKKLKDEEKAAADEEKKNKSTGTTGTTVVTVDNKTKGTGGTGKTGKPGKDGKPGEDAVVPEEGEGDWTDYVPIALTALATIAYAGNKNARKAMNKVGAAPFKFAWNKGIKPVGRRVGADNAMRKRMGNGIFGFPAAHRKVGKEIDSGKWLNNPLRRTWDTGDSKFNPILGPVNPNGPLLGPANNRLIPTTQYGTAGFSLPYTQQAKMAALAQPNAQQSLAALHRLGAFTGGVPSVFQRSPIKLNLS